MSQDKPMTLAQTFLYAPLHGLLLPSFLFACPIFVIPFVIYLYEIVELGPFWLCYMIPYLVAWLLGTIVLFFAFRADERKRVREQEVN